MLHAGLFRAKLHIEPKLIPRDVVFVAEIKRAHRILRRFRLYRPGAGQHGIHKIRVGPRRNSNWSRQFAPRRTADMRRRPDVDHINIEAPTGESS